MMDLDHIGEESRLWKFEPADTAPQPLYRLLNVHTRRYLADSADASETPLLLSVIRVGGTESAPEYCLSGAAGRLTWTADGSTMEQTGTTFRLLSFAAGEVTRLQPGGTYGLCSVDTGRLLTDPRPPYATLSRTATQRSQAAVQKWHIAFHSRAGATEYYSLLNLDSNRFLAADGSGAYLSAKKNAADALWAPEKAAENGCRGYRLVNAAGNRLYWDTDAGCFYAGRQVPAGADDVFLLEGGADFRNSWTVHIAALTGGQTPEYRYLQAVKAGAEIPLSLQTATGTANQKWLIEYVSGEERPGYWYKKQYYTVKSVAYGLYLTMRGGTLTLAERDASDDFQLWNFFDLYYGWGLKGAEGGSPRFANQYSLINKGARVALVAAANRLSYAETNADNIYFSGAAGCSWRLNGQKLDLGQSAGNDDPARLVSSVEVTLEAYTLALYLEAT